MQLVDIVDEAWGWSGLKPDSIVGDNPFGNLIVKDKEGRYWRLCPEDLYCRMIAGSRAELDMLSRDRDFLHDWNMSELVRQAREKLGPLRPGFKYCLKIPGALGGEYGGENLATMTLEVLVSASGSIARQIDQLPDGASISLVVT
ncbi:MAG: DUF1851 domain-containing protein [Stenotrophomonas acidaminiphila]|nr:MAG: DUF1851 domain-containing protein [Stenotrophomonas acidaminiphila]